MKPQNFEESVIWYYIIGSMGLYFIGALFVTGPAVAWLLALYLIKRLWQQTDATPADQRVSIPPGVWVWVGAMLVIGLALVIGHINFNYDDVKIIKSFINFFLRTWALLALFPLIGCLNIRPQLLYRAICILCLQCLILVPIAYLLSTTGIETPLYNVSLMAKIGGNSERFYNVSLFLRQEGEVRLLIFAPWAPALAFAGNIYFCLASQDPDKKWRWIGMLSSAIMVWGSASRLGLLCLISLPFLKAIATNLSRPSVQIATGISSFAAGLFGPQLIGYARDFKDYFDSQRASSSNLRELLQRMALYQWQEAPIWGHGIKAPRGPAVANFMPIGSHHTWLGLLYVHGVVGFIALAIAMLYSFIELIIKAQRSRTAQTGLAVLLVLFLFSFGENLETLAYLYWPGLLMLGIALKEPFPALFAHLKPQLNQSQA
jgi:hypothetical protein